MSRSSDIIFITISRGGIARNILKTDFFILLKREFKKIVILTTAASDRRFTDEFKADNVEFIPLLEFKPNYCDRLISRLNCFLIYNKNTKRLSLYDYVEVPSRLKFIVKYVKYIFLRILFFPLSKLKFLRRFLRLLDSNFLHGNVVASYQNILRQYNPTLVFVTNIVEDSEIFLLRAAQKEKIKTVAMAKSWDNPSKRFFRARADKFIVWSDFMVEQMKEIQGYDNKDLAVVGVPQFDFYTDKKRLLPREEFCRQMGLDPNKKIIFFGSEGKVMPTDAQTAELLHRLITENKLIYPCQLLVRPHFGYKNDHLKFANLIGKKDAVVDVQNSPSQAFNDQWDYSDWQNNHLFNSLYHSDVVINTCSTLTLDGAAVGRPVILIMFNGDEKKYWFHETVARWYVCDYYNEILQTKAAYEAWNTAGLLEGLNICLQDKNFLLSERKKLLDKFCYKNDGQSGQRLFVFIKSLL